MNLKNNILIFFGELPQTSKNGIAFNNVKLLSKLKKYFRRIIYIQDLPHKNYKSYFFIILKLVYFILINIKFKKSIIYFTLSQGRLGIFKSLFLSSSAFILRKDFIIHLHRGDLLISCEKSYWYKLVVFWIFQKAKAILCISQMQKKEVEDFFKIDTKKVLFFPNKINLEKYKEISKKNFILENVDYLDSIRLIFIGPIVKTKGIDKLLDNLYKFHRGKIFNKNVDLTIVGKNVEKEILLDYKNRIIYKGELRHEKAMELLNSSDILILPSLSEGMPYVVLESILFEVPILCTRVGYVEEILGKDYPLYIDIFSSSSIKEKLIFYLLNKQKMKNLIKNKRNIVLNYFSTDNINKLMNILS